VLWIACCQSLSLREWLSVAAQGLLAVAVSLGPCLTLLIDVGTFSVGALRFDSYTGPGYLLFALFLVLLVVAFLWFESPALPSMPPPTPATVGPSAGTAGPPTSVLTTAPAAPARPSRWAVLWRAASTRGTGSFFALSFLEFFVYSSYGMRLT
jgi:hypothetical protein